MLRIMLVEDDPSDAFFFRSMLELLHLKDIDLLLAEDAEEAIGLLEQEPHPVLIFTDYSLPGDNGIEFIRRLKASEQWSAIPVVILSGRAQSLPVGNGEEAILDKPIPAETLRQQLIPLMQ